METWKSLNNEWVWNPTEDVTYRIVKPDSNEPFVLYLNQARVGFTLSVAEAIELAETHWELRF